MSQTLTAMASALPALPAGMRFIERDWLSANGVLFDDGTHTVLVDTGYIAHRETTLAVVQHLLGGRRLDGIVNTHLHSDHCGGNALLQRTWGCRTLIPAGSAQAVSQWDTHGLTFKATGQRCERFTFDDVIRDGQMLELGGLPWTVIAAPGHDPEMVVLYSAPARVLISADALWANGFGVIFPELEGASGFAEQRAILQRIAQLDVDLVIPGHGPMFADVQGALQRAHSRLDHLSADPSRNARHATKVLLKFLLLEHRQVPMVDVPALMDTIPLITTANRLYIGMEPGALADWAVDDLVRAGAAAIENGLLIDR
jgi:glyoxylase-like metal-dependent hydrolase (beta-lactamase superfamily II)